jgi:hypothetical protein
MVAAAGGIDYHVHTPEDRVSPPAAKMLAGQSSFERRVADTPQKRRKTWLFPPAN